jgi:hypothetical protein
MMMVVTSRIAMAESLVAKGRCMGLQRGSNGMFGCKGRGSCAESAQSRIADGYLRGKTAVGESPWLRQIGAWTDGYGHWEAVGVHMQWERAEMLVELQTVVRCKQQGGGLTTLRITGTVGG